MAKVGRKPNPSRKNKLTGNPGKRPANKNEPQPDIPEKIPRAPRNLDATAKKEWRRMAKQLHRLGLLTVSDLSAFASYCSQYSIWYQATEAIREHGILVKAQSGFPAISPWVSVANKAQTEMRKWLTEFGMTPSSRSRIDIPKPKEKSAMQRYREAGFGLKAVK